MTPAQAMMGHLLVPILKKLVRRNWVRVEIKHDSIIDEKMGFPKSAVIVYGDEHITGYGASPTTRGEDEVKTSGSGCGKDCIANNLWEIASKNLERLE